MKPSSRSAAWSRMLRPAGRKGQPQHSTGQGQGVHKPSSLNVPISTCVLVNHKKHTNHVLTHRTAGRLPQGSYMTPSMLL
jgi:hypothetical protein